MTTVSDTSVDTTAADDFSDLNQLDPAPPAAAGRSRSPLIAYVGPVVTFVVFVALWEYMHRTGLRTFFDKPGRLLPSLATVVDKSFVNPQPNVRNQLLVSGLGWTTFAALVGLLITIVLGITLAVVMAQASWAERSIYPYLVALQAIPVLAIVPIIYVIFGGGMGSRIFVCVMISIFPIVTNTLFGLTSAEVGQHDLFTLRGASRWTRLVKLQFPAAMPAIFTGFRISAGLSVIGAVVGEQFFRQGSKPGIGIIMEQFRQKSRYPELFGGLLIAAALGIAVFLLFGALSKAVVGHWHESTRKAR
jgi:NitT/TauT family transport system permease protein